MYALVVSNGSYREKTKKKLNWQVSWLENIWGKTCVWPEKILGVGADVSETVTDFQVFIFTIEWSMVLTLDYNRRCCVDLALLFCNDSQEMGKWSEERNYRGKYIIYQINKLLWGWDSRGTLSVTLNCSRRLCLVLCFNYGTIEKSRHSLTLK